MKISALRAAALSLVATASFAAPALSQTTGTPPAPTATRTDAFSNPLSGDNATSSDPFAQTGSTQMSTIMNILQQATSGGGYVPPEEFSQQQSESINSEASDFRSRQLELLQQQSQPSVSTPTAVPTP